MDTTVQYSFSYSLSTEQQTRLQHNNSRLFGFNHYEFQAFKIVSSAK